MTPGVSNGGGTPLCKAKAGCLALCPHQIAQNHQTHCKLLAQGQAVGLSREGEVTSYLFRDVPAERRSSQASTTRFAMPASATFPHARGSYAFLLPTSPSTLSTPS